MNSDERPLTLVDYWRVIWRMRLLVVVLTVLATLMGYGATFVMKRVYSSRASILSPRDQAATGLSLSLGAMLGGAGAGGGGGSILNSLPGISTSLPTVSTNQDMLVALLKSRTIREQVLASLETTWGPTVSKQILAVEPNTADRGVINLGVDATDPNLAAELANAMFTHLDRMVQDRAEETAKHQERMYQTQLDRAAREVQAAEDALLKFQSENRFLASSVDTAGSKAGAEPTVQMRMGIMNLEMQREVMRMRYTDQHPQMREIDRQIAELKRQYSQALFGGAMDLPAEGPNARGPKRKEFFVSAERMTPVQLAFLKHVRNLKIQEAFYAAALQNLEQIKYGNGPQTPRIEFIDRAIPAGSFSRPNVRVILPAAAGAGLVAGIFVALFLEYLRRVREREADFAPPPPTPERGARGRVVPPMPAPVPATPYAVPAHAQPTER